MLKFRTEDKTRPGFNRIEIDKGSFWTLKQKASASFVPNSELSRRNGAGAEVEDSKRIVILRIWKDLLFTISTLSMGNAQHQDRKQFLVKFANQPVISNRKLDSKGILPFNGSAKRCRS